MQATEPKSNLDLVRLTHTCKDENDVRKVMKSLNCKSPDNIDWLPFPQRGGLHFTGAGCSLMALLFSPHPRQSELQRVKTWVCEWQCALALRRPPKQPRHAVPL